MSHQKRNWLERLRKMKGYSQEDIAYLVHIDRSYYSKIESGVRIPSKRLAENLADLLKFHVSIFELEESPFYFALQDSPMVIAHFDLNLRYTWIFNPNPELDPVSVIGRNDVELGDNPGTRELMKVKQEVIKNRTSLRKVIVFPIADQLYEYDVNCHPLFNHKGELIGGSSASTQLIKEENRISDHEIHS
ncbi:helix-turn-helix domain-containing protein [Rossellomorea vietnamensis]|uniref:helix-turn-helix domain-containing protein n=1 Tax=Rossellomorea vietnamensis TaxID=218284 RepID=UPI001E2B5AE4|nr:helix-turn-helix domain-containing protein [Rossellomorea vietnamensis]MCC5801037.1 helix-turn-helix domain-containing protein [Rossellomorea vietnamensis]